MTDMKLSPALRNALHTDADSANRWFVCSLVLACVLLIVAALLLAQLAESRKLRMANEELVEQLMLSAVSSCYAFRLGDVAWFRIGNDGEPECVRAFAPPGSEEWRVYLRNSFKNRR